MLDEKFQQIEEHIMKTIIFLLLILSNFFGAAFAAKNYIHIRVLLASEPGYYINYKTLDFKTSTTRGNNSIIISDREFGATGKCIWSLWPLDHLLRVRFKIYKKTSNGDKPFCSVDVGARADSVVTYLVEPVKYQRFSGDTCYKKASYQHKESGNKLTLTITIPPQ
jgi:hypothetical protein